MLLGESNLLGDTSRGLAAEFPHRLRQTFGAEAVSFFDRGTGFVFRSGAAAISSPDNVLKDTALQGTFHHDAANARFLVPVSLGGHVTGSLEVLGGAISEAAVQAVANLLAIALEREAAQNAALQADTARSHEELKSTLLDALAHELKTPLTSIKAAVTALLEEGSDAATQHELLTVVNEETDRLSGMVTEAIQMARIEAGQLKLSKQAVAPGALVYPALEQLQSRLDGRPVKVTIDPQPGAGASGCRTDFHHRATTAGQRREVFSAPKPAGSFSQATGRQSGDYGDRSRKRSSATRADADF